MASRRKNLKAKNGRAAKKLSDVEKPEVLVTKAEKFEDFLAEWGRITIPLIVFGTLALLHLIGVLDDVALGYAIGLVLLLAMPLAVALIVLRGYFPRWAQVITIIMTVLYMGGTLWPFTNMVYPGVPEFARDITREEGKVTMPRDIEGGYYWVEIFAKSFSKVAGLRNEQGRYVIDMDGQRISGEFSDQPISGNMGTFEGTMLRQLTALDLAPGPLEVRAIRVDNDIGPVVTITGFHMPVAPTVFFSVLLLVLAWAVFVDGWFQSQTWKWRLAPWVGVSFVFLAFFYWTWEPARMPATAVWSSVIGGIGGFLGGWLLSMIARLSIGRMRAKL